MCGIVGYIGHREAYPIVLKGLQRLEYRGYDSAGIALYDGEELKMCKTKGKVADLKQKFEEEVNTNGTVGIGHTRWATHGEPNDVNSHPHYSNSGDLVIIHNGIIENYDSLKKELKKRGYTFKSDTDTEVLVNLIEDVIVNEKVKAPFSLASLIAAIVSAVSPLCDMEITTSFSEITGFLYLNSEAYSTSTGILAISSKIYSATSPACHEVPQATIIIRFAFAIRSILSSTPAILIIP